MDRFKAGPFAIIMSATDLSTIVALEFTDDLHNVFYQHQEIKQKQF